MDRKYSIGGYKPKYDPPYPKTVKEYFSKVIPVLQPDDLYIVRLPVIVGKMRIIESIIDWCENHLYHEYSQAFLGAIEGDAEEWLIHLVPESSPTGWFFAFKDYDDAIMFYFTWKGVE